MSLWGEVTHGLRVLTRRQRADRDVDDEVQHFLDEAATVARQDGASASGARRATRLAFGNVTTIREEVRSAGWEVLITTLLADLRYALRGMRRRPGFAVVWRASHIDPATTLRS